jgi:Ca-activated chloride channel family protein
MTQRLPILDQVEEPGRVGITERGFGSLNTTRGNLPLRRLQVAAEIDGLVASIVVRQTFVNSLTASDGESLEATYIFPLPDRAAVTRFEMRIGSRVIAGVLRERGQARKEYDAAIKTGHRAAIAEEERSGVFTMRVGNILPGEEATVLLELTGPIPVDDGEATFQFPLVVAPRYIPGTPLPGPSVGDGTACDTDAVPDASRITPPVLLPGFPNPVELDLSVVVRDSGLALREFRSSLHAVVEEAMGDGARRIVVTPGERLNRDFLLRYRVADASIHTSLQFVPDDGENSTAGTFQLTVVPPGGTTPPRPRDVVFVLDRSGSMQGWKIVTARRAICRIIDTLGPADRFSVIVFSDRMEFPPRFAVDGLEPANDRTRFAAIEYLARLDADGGTEILKPLVTGLETLHRADDARREKILVLLTDGQIGNEDQAIKACRKKLGGVRVFALGIDQAVNAGFLQKLAALGGGFAEVVESEDRLDEVLEKVHRRIGTPVVTDVRVDLPGCKIDQDTLTPRRLPDLFAGVPLVIRGRYAGATPRQAHITAIDSAGQRWTPTVAVTAAAGSAGFRTLWAREQVRALEDAYVSQHERDQNLAKQIIECSLKFGVLSRFTAYVAVDRSEIVNAGGECREIVQPVELPAGWGEEASQSFAARRRAMPSAVFSLNASADTGDGSDVYGLGAACRGSIESHIANIFIDRSAPSPPYLGRELHAMALPSPTVYDPDAFRQRAGELLAIGRRLVASKLQRMLSHLFQPFAKLVAYLEAVAAPAAVVAPLRDLLTEIEQHRVAKGDEAQAQALWKRIEQVLEKFVNSQAVSGDGGDPAAGARRKEFWT